MTMIRPVLAWVALLAAGCGDGGADMPVDPVCGDGVVDPGEACDGADLNDGTCQSEVERGGILACSAECTYDVSGCTLAACGNGVAEDGESCDGDDLAGASCTSVGFSAGGLACTGDCVFDVSACCTDNCLIEDATMCIGDSLRTCEVAASGCLLWQVTDCTADGEVCDESGEVAACMCIDRCPADGDLRCEGAVIETCAMQDGCLDWTAVDDCGEGGLVCAVAPSGPMCVADASAEDCSDPYPLAAGENVVAWTALNADYMIAQPSCNTTALDGPDLVLSYTAPDDGFITFSIDKPASARQVIVASAAACGTLTPEVACISDFTPTTIGTEFGVSAGVTYHVYVRDTTSGTAPLDNPLIVTVDETLCSTLTPVIGTLSPANGASVADRTPILTAEAAYPIGAASGVITLVGDQGTNLTYDLATGPPQVSLTNGGKTLVIDPGLVFPAGENVTVSWTGLQDATCGAAIAAPTWTFQVTGPPCTPGTGGMVGGTVTRIPTGISSLTEYFVEADHDPAGYVYVGGTTQLFRTPKAGGTTQDVSLAAPLSSSHLGYGMVIVGDQVFTLESNTTATTNVLWRISADGGDTWGPQSYMTLPQTPNDDLRGTAVYGGRIYMTTDESSAGTQIWSVPADATTLPVTAVLETTVPGEQYCTGIALDDYYFYLTCYNDDRILRVDRSSFAVELITDVIDVNITRNAVHAHDFDADGSADALYVSTYYEEVHYICAPGGSGPFWVDILASFGTSSSNYGLGFDPVAGTLWMFDDDTREFVSIE